MVRPGAKHASPRRPPRGRTAAPLRVRAPRAGARPRRRGACRLPSGRAACRATGDPARAGDKDASTAAPCPRALGRDQTDRADDRRDGHPGEGKRAVQTALAALRLAQNNPEAAKTALAPVLDDATADANPTWVLAQACLLEARARDALGDAGAAERALERALDLTEPDGLLLPFLFHPTPGLLERHSRFRTTHGSLISEILNLLAGKQPARTLGEPARMLEALSDSELRVLRYLPTNLSNQEIAGEALRVGEHGQGPHPASLRQARRPPPRRGG